MKLSAIPWVEMPDDFNTQDEVMAFDAAGCKHGFKEFTRRMSTWERDFIAKHEPRILDEKCDTVIVRELFPGARTRHFVKRLSISCPS